MSNLVHKFDKIEENIVSLTTTLKKSLLEFHQTILPDTELDIYYSFETYRNVFSIGVNLFAKEVEVVFPHKKEPKFILKNEEFLTDNIEYFEFLALKANYGKMVEGILLSKITKWFQACWLESQKEAINKQSCYFIWIKNRELYDLKKEEWVF